MFYLPTNPNISEYVSGNTGIFLDLSQFLFI